MHLPPAACLVHKFPIDFLFFFRFPLSSPPTIISLISSILYSRKRLCAQFPPLSFLTNIVLLENKIIVCFLHPTTCSRHSYIQYANTGWLVLYWLKYWVESFLFLSWCHLFLTCSFTNVGNSFLWYFSLWYVKYPSCTIYGKHIRKFVKITSPSQLLLNPLQSSVLFWLDINPECLN